MRPRALCLLAGTIALAGCGSNVAAGPTATTQPGNPTTTTAVSGGPTPTSKGTQIAVSSDPYKAGQVDIRAHDYAGAAVQFQRAIDQHHNVAPAYAGLGTAELARGRYNAGYRAYKKALALSPKGASYLYGAAYGALYSGDFKGAVRYASQLLQAQPKNAMAYHLRMLAYGRLIMPKLQAHDAQQVARLEPGNAQAYNDLGIAYANTQHYKKSIVAFDHAIGLQPKTYSFYSNRGIVENQMKNSRAALADFEKARSLAPDAHTKLLLSQVIDNLKKQMHK